MAVQPANELREMLKAALAAYEQAQAVRLQEQRRAEAAQTQEEAQRTRADQSARAEAETEHGRRLAVADGEQERLAQLLGETAALEEAAQTLLKSAGLAHIAGAPAAVDGTPAKARRGDAEVTAAFAAAHTAYVQLRTVLCQLAAAQVEAGRWEAARQTLQPLLLAKDAPLYGVAAELERDSYLRAAQRALDAEEWEAARQQADLWLKRAKGDQEILALRWESYYSPAKQAFIARQFALACTCLEGLAIQQVEYKDSATLLLNAYRSLPRKSHPKIKGLEFVQIPAGEFLYGENKERVQVDSFWISLTPITNAQYKQFQTSWSITAGKEDHPVVNVSWEDAQQFCGWGGVRLPREREWEKAARGVDGRAYPWGNQEPNATLCNFNNQVKDTTPVGKYPQGASPYSVLDMAGNVWEWCEDSDGGSSRVLRGGAFNCSGNYVRCAYRDGGNPTSRYYGFGFRVVAPSF